ncbi:MAG: TonB-dependent receptor [Tannerella sp.]|jgi:TonB-linked SusC/RagA family outer membrane protein|nr:TonB-dependent receptor [Tannerella sp.]
MKKKNVLLELSQRVHSGRYLRFGKILKLTVALWLLVSGFVFAGNVDLQNTKISLNKQQALLREVLDEIERQTDYLFVSNTEISLEHRVSVQVKNKSVREVLDRLFENTDLAYAVDGVNIIITKKVLPSGAITAPQQTGRQVAGTVTDAAGEPVIGANVLEKGSTNGVVTDVDGNFSLTVADNAVLQISYIGYITQEISVLAGGGGKLLSVRLLEDNMMLEEVVVVGYGTQKKVNLSGSVSSISSKTLENRMTSNVNLALQGAAPNMNISMGSGRANYAPDINIRGYTSVNGGSAFILVDNVPVSAQELSRINPADIENVSVLKDASASAIYGARAAFGVVLITTRKAKSSKLEVDADLTYGVRQMFSTPDIVTDVVGFMDLTRLSCYPYYLSSGRIVYNESEVEYARQVAADPSLPRIIPHKKDKGGIYEPERYGYYESTDWIGATYRNTTPSYNVNARIAQKHEKGSYMVSAAYYQQDGLVRYEEGLKRYNIRAIGDYDLTRWWNVGTNISFVNSNYRYPNALDRDNGNGFFTGVQQEDCIYPTYPNPDGTLNIAMAELTETLKRGGDVEDNVYETQVTLNTNISLLKDVWNIKADASFRRYSNGIEKATLPIAYSEIPGIINYTNNNISTAESIHKVNSYNVFNVYTDFHKTFARKHFLNAVAGFNQESLYINETTAKREGLISASLPTVQLATGEDYVSQSISELALRSMFYRLNYIFDNKYIAELSGRYDGSSRYPKAERFGFFPSGSLAWVLSREGFMEDLAERLKIDQLKFRGSYGILGNQANNNYYPYVASMESSTMSNIIDGLQPLKVIQPGTVAGNLTWEKVRTINGGIDLTLFNRLDLSFDLYTRYTEGMLTQLRQLPAFYGAGAPSTNAADLKTKGWDLTVGYRDQFTAGGSPFSWGVHFLLADSRAWITKYDSSSLIPDDFSEYYNHYEGKEIGEIWGLTTLGYLTADDFVDVENNVLKVDQSKVGSNDTRYLFYVGDLKFEDINGDGVVDYGDNTVDNPGDRKIIGNSSSRFPYSIMLDAAWKGFDLQLFFQGIGKRDWYPRPGQTFWGVYSAPWSSPIRENYDRWTEENPSQNAFFPRMKSIISEEYGGPAGTKDEMASPQTRYLQDASYLRLKTLDFGYTLPRKVTDKWNIGSLRIFFNGENLFTISHIQVGGIDPELLGRQYPLQKVYSFGLNLSL